MVSESTRFSCVYRQFAPKSIGGHILYPLYMPFPPLLTVRQHFADRSIADIPGTIREELAASGFAAHPPPGARIAIGIGSRGIANLATIVRAVIDFWKSRGFAPFLF